MFLKSSTQQERFCCLILNFFRSYGYDAEHHETYAMVSGMIHGGISLGAGISPILAGVITQLVGYDWFVTTSALLCLVMVSSLYVPNMHRTFWLQRCCSMKSWLI